MLDQTDRNILILLKSNAKMQMREIGEQVHLSGQGVANRIKRLENLGIICGYAAILDEAQLGVNISAYITVFMKTTDHAAFGQFLKTNTAVTEANRISGDGCYLLKVAVASQVDLNAFLDCLLLFGNYRLNICVDRIK